MTEPCDPTEKADAVNRMFASIAARYDLMNRIMTAGRDQAWRRMAIGQLACFAGDLVLDVGSGTGDFLPLLAQAGVRVIGTDFTLPMMEAGKAKLHDLGYRAAFVAGDALHLPFADNSFDGIINGFLLRNVTSVSEALSEMKRVVRPGGRVVCLEITWPTLPVFKQAFAIYFSKIVPLIGGMVSGQRSAYSYLPASVAAFMSANELAEAMRDVGFRVVRYRRLALGTVALHVGTK